MEKNSELPPACGFGLVRSVIQQSVGLSDLRESPAFTRSHFAERRSLAFINLSKREDKGTLIFPAPVSGRPSSCSQNPFNFCLLALGASILAK
jgi:hypothetical protein